MFGRGECDIIPHTGSLSSDASTLFEYPYQHAVVNPLLSRILAVIFGLALYEVPWSPAAWLLSRPTGSSSYRFGKATGHVAYRRIAAWLGSLPYAHPTEEQFYLWCLRLANLIWPTLACLPSFLEDEQYYQWPLVIGHSYWIVLVWFLPLLLRAETYAELWTLGLQIGPAIAWLLSPPVRRQYYQWVLALSHLTSLLLLVFRHAIYLWCLKPLAYLIYWWGPAVGYSIQLALTWLLSRIAQRTYQVGLALGHFACLGTIFVRSIHHSIMAFLFRSKIGKSMSELAKTAKEQLSRFQELPTSTKVSDPSTCRILLLTTDHRQERTQ